MYQHIIRKKAKDNFFIFWVKDNLVGLPNSGINLDFSPFTTKILSNFPRVNFYCLLHWQAMPKGLRRWGLYDSTSQKYYSVDEIEAINNTKFITLQLDENIIKTVPVAVLFFPNAKLLEINTYVSTGVNSSISVTRASIGG